jgi:hypothetical protein
MIKHDKQPPQKYTTTNNMNGRISQNKGRCGFFSYMIFDMTKNKCLMKNNEPIRKLL